MYSLDDYSYDLPEALIAQYPVPGRDGSRMLVMDRHTGSLRHCRFRDVVDRLDPTDLMVVNNTRVIPARLKGTKETGGRAEVLLLNYADGRKTGGADSRFVCRCLVKASKRPKTGSLLNFGPELQAEVLDFRDGIFTLAFIHTGDFDAILQRIGAVPLPPYIRREAACYGTVRRCISSLSDGVCLPKGCRCRPHGRTALFHVPLLDRIRSKGRWTSWRSPCTSAIRHVSAGPGRRHPGPPDARGKSYTVGRPAAAAIGRARQRGPAGWWPWAPPACRTLEHVSAGGGTLVPGSRHVRPVHLSGIPVQDRGQP